MSQRLVHAQEQRQQQVQRLSRQQMLQVRLLEMPLAELEAKVAAELYDNPALEAVPGGVAGDAMGYDEVSAVDGDGDGSATVSEREERDAALDAALEGLEGDDAMPPAYDVGAASAAVDRQERVLGGAVSFYDGLLQQVSESGLDGEERYVAEYIVGSIDDDGYLRKDDATLADELAIYHGIDLSPESVHRLVGVVQRFDPPGIAAHDLRECLLLQIERRSDDAMKPLMRAVIERYYDAFTKKHRERIGAALHLSDAVTSRLFAELRRLNPKPGASLGASSSWASQHITPDFIIESGGDGVVTFTVNGGDIPELRVAQSFIDMVDTYRNNKRAMTRRDKEALLYAKEKADRARGFIEAVRQRRRTLCVTMQAIIDWQRRYFDDGDEAELRPMILKDIAERTGLDISTISRVSNVKYAQTPWGTVPLRFFFSDGYTTGEGEELSTRRIKAALRDIVSGEDKSAPLPDEAIARMLAQQGYPVSRRTVAKYREQLGIPVARLRR